MAAVSGPKRRLIEVPAVFREVFETNPLRALRDLGAVPSLAIEPWDADGSLRREQCNPDRAHPLGEEGRQVGARRWYFHPRLRCAPEDTAPRWVHVDLALSRDCCGMAMGHAKPIWVEVAVPDGGTERRPHVVLDLLLRIRAPRGGQISFEGVRERIYELSERGYLIEGVSYDGWQSVDSLQILAERGYHTEECSVDKTLGPYENLLELMRLRAVDYYYYEPFLHEWERLTLIKGKKVDHVPGESKDVTDAAAGAAWNVVLHARQDELFVG